MFIVSCFNIYVYNVSFTRFIQITLHRSKTEQPEEVEWLYIGYLT